MRVLFLEDAPRIVVAIEQGSPVTAGPFRAGEAADLPRDVAEILVAKGVCAEVP